MNSIIDSKCVNSLRVVGAEMITKANSGHPGIVLGAAPILHTLYTRFMNVNGEDEKWFNRDRFVLSVGHGSTLLYMLLHLSGFNLTMDDLKNLRQKGSQTPGHPEYGHVPGVEITTGPLGQGIASAVGMAIVEDHMSNKYNKPGYDIINHYTYVMCGDGDLQEGIAMEAVSLAGHLNLNKLIMLYDSNDIQLDGEVSLANSEDTKMKFESMGWNYIFVKDGNDIENLANSISKAQNSNKPTIIEIKTIIGYGAPNAGESSIHGKPMAAEDIKVLRKNLAYSEPELTFADDVVEYYRNTVIERGKAKQKAWSSLLHQYGVSYPEEHKELLYSINYSFDLSDRSLCPKYEDGSMESTRKVMGKVIDWISNQMPNIMGGSADLTASTMVKGADGIYGPGNHLGRNIKFGVREHSMAAITNGITLHGGMRGFCAGFFVFSDYLKPAVRQAAIMRIPSLFLFSHDTVCVGEDGPTHQPIEHFAMFRSMPNVNVYRPADAREMTVALIDSFKNNTYPTVITSSRQAVLNLKETKEDGVLKGAYTVINGNSDYILLSCGTELSIAIDAAKVLKDKGIDVSVVSMPSMFLFDKQSKEYKESVLPKNKKVMAIEMGSTLPWYKYADYVKGIDEYGKSMSIKYIFDEYGFTPNVIADEFMNNVYNK